MLSEPRAHRHLNLGLLGVLAPVALLLAALLIAAAPSSAHQSRWLVHPGGGQAYELADHHHLYYCDTQRDGHNVWVGYYDHGREKYETTGPAPSNDCDYMWLAWGIYKFRVCISYEGCTGFKVHSSPSWRPR